MPIILHNQDDFERAFRRDAAKTIEELLFAVDEEYGLCRMDALRLAADVINCMIADESIAHTAPETRLDIHAQAARMSMQQATEAIGNMQGVGNEILKMVREKERE